MTYIHRIFSCSIVNQMSFIQYEIESSIFIICYHFKTVHYCYKQTIQFSVFLPEILTEELLKVDFVSI